ncbi:MAG: ribosomal RNA small subunit methyltransferase A [Bacillales bacterium]|nr:ribosomal RNA small subunit methyltransferase A [Bacillales bacterium]
MSASKKETLSIIKNNNIKVKKHFGQCFLTDGNIINKIASLPGERKNTTVVEVGPGLGYLTEALLKKYRKVIAYEIDKDMIQILKEKFKNEKNLEIIEGDILKGDLNEDLKEIEGEVISVSNLPYYITSPIITLFLEKADRVKDMYFMVQKEVADRVSAIPGNKDYNAFSVSLQYETTVKKLLDVKRECFTPSPNVDSAVIEIKKKEEYKKAKDESLFKKIINSSFSQRRKTLINNLSMFPIDKEELKQIIISLGFDENIRAERLTIEDFIKLSDIIGGYYESRN